METQNLGSEWGNSDPPRKAKPPQTRKEQDTKKCKKAYVPLVIICLATWLWKTTQTIERKPNYTKTGAQLNLQIRYLENGR